MKTNSVPFSDQPPGSTPDNTRVANFLQNDQAANGYDDGFAATGAPYYDSNQNYLTDVGAYIASPSYYGTFDQGGNLPEWNDAQLSDLLRGVRGGPFDDLAGAMQASSRQGGSPTGEGTIGFRVATITAPEPSACVLIDIGVAAYAFFRRRPTSHNRVERAPTLLLDTLVVRCYDACMDDQRTDRAQLSEPTSLGFSLRRYFASITLIACGVGIESWFWERPHGDFVHQYGHGFVTLGLATIGAGVFTPFKRTVLGAIIAGCIWPTFVILMAWVESLHLWHS